MVYFLGFLTLLMVWVLIRVEVRGGWVLNLVIHGVFMLLAIAFAAGTEIAWLAERGQL